MPRLLRRVAPRNDSDWLRIGYRRNSASRVCCAVAFVLLMCGAVAGCAQHDRDDQDSRSGGFYGGVTGGMTR